MRSCPNTQSSKPLEGSEQDSSVGSIPMLYRGLAQQANGTDGQDPAEPSPNYHYAAHENRELRRAVELEQNRLRSSAPSGLAVDVDRHARARFEAKGSIAVDDARVGASRNGDGAPQNAAPARDVASAGEGDVAAAIRTDAADGRQVLGDVNGESLGTASSHLTGAFSDGEEQAPGPAAVETQVQAAPTPSRRRAQQHYQKSSQAHPQHSLSRLVGLAVLSVFCVVLGGCEAVYRADAFGACAKSCGGHIQRVSAGREVFECVCALADAGVR